jgi:hypothetical protein
VVGIGGKMKMPSCPNTYLVTIVADTAEAMEGRRRAEEKL